MLFERMWYMYIAIESAFRAQIDLGIQFLTKNSATEFMIMNHALAWTQFLIHFSVSMKKTFHKRENVRAKNRSNQERGGN
jgi:hypothetical protein